MFFHRMHKHSWTTPLVIFVLVVTVATYLFTMRVKPRYAASLAIAVNRINKQVTPDYQYDGYYALQASDLFSQTLLSWFLTPSVILDFYQKAGVDPHVTTTNELVSRFKARKFAAQNIVVQFTERDRDAAQKLADGISSTVRSRSAELDKNATGDSTFEVVPSTAVIVEVKPNPVLNTIAAAVASLLLGLAALWTVQSLRGGHEDRH